MSVLAVVPAAAFVVLSETGAWLIPSMLLGHALALLVAASLVRRWERRTGRRALAGGDGALYARE